MCKISRHTTLLLSGIADFESRVVEMANQGAGLLFIGAEILANLACRSCSIHWIKPLPAFAIVVEESLIFNFAIDCKVHFSLKIQRKSNLKTASANCFFNRDARARSRATSRAHHASRRMRVACARRGTGGPSGPCAAPGVLLLVTFASAWTTPSG
jgi:hypothetical protein